MYVFPFENKSFDTQILYNNSIENRDLYFLIGSIYNGMNI